MLAVRDPSLARMWRALAVTSLALAGPFAVLAGPLPEACVPSYFCAGAQPPLAVFLLWASALPYLASLVALLSHVGRRGPTARMYVGSVLGLLGAAEYGVGLALLPGFGGSADWLVWGAVVVPLLLAAASAWPRPDRSGDPRARRSHVVVLRAGSGTLALVAFAGVWGMGTAPESVLDGGGILFEMNPWWAAQPGMPYLVGAAGAAGVALLTVLAWARPRWNPGVASAVSGGAGLLLAAAAVGELVFWGWIGEGTRYWAVDPLGTLAWSAVALSAVASVAFARLWALEVSLPPRSKSLAVDGPSGRTNRERDPSAGPRDSLAP